ncbi:MAG: polysaccharide biosynthesis/export family protein [Bacteroidota bacterium]
MSLPKCKFFLLAFLLIIQISSCTVSQQSTTYFSGSGDTTLILKTDDVEPIIQKNDILSIYISSLNPEASAVFNAPNLLATSSSTTSGSSSAGGYLVNTDGNIQLPILGTIKASGITKKQLKADITNLILDKKLLIDPIITIRHLNYEVTVIGEVGKPIVINVPNEKISLLKALGLAGDITVYGKKDNVMLVREVEGKRKVKRIDLNDKSFLSSNYYYLQPNDIVYVEANKWKVINANRNQQLLPSILSGLSIIALVITTILLRK